MIYIDEIASTTSQSIDFVKKDLQIMIARKLFENAYLDLSTNELIINLQNRVEPELLDDEFQDVDEDVETVTCSGCGASNSKQYGVASSCEYCGSPLK
ncbi:hypothetical protein [Desulfosporosinus sp. SB140]|uniref:hypothetical protein n=1 Tax=Desulfosporosinus paludis TaxID=3115649 RepID=UPI00389045ED